MPALVRAAFGALMTALTSAGPLAAAELVYVREAGCPYCRMWDERIGPIYGKTAEGRQAPLREIEKRGVALAELHLARPIRYTPTFVLVADNVEVGRIEGYPGEEFFFPRLARLLDEARARTSSSSAAAQPPFPTRSAP